MTRDHGEDEPTIMADVLACLERVKQVGHHGVGMKGVDSAGLRLLFLLVRCLSGFELGKLASARSARSRV